MRDEYEVVGEAVVQEMAVGIDWNALINASASAAKTGIEQKQASDTAKKAKHDSDAAIARAIEADAAWANAEANAELAKSDATSSAAANVIRDSARREAAAAGAALQGDGIAKRCAVARAALNRTAAAAEVAPKDIAAQAKFHAWKTVSDSCAVPAPSGGTHDGGAVPGSGFLETLNTKRGGLPVWGWGLVGAGVLTVLGILLRSFSHGKRRR